jgi:RNA 2',3'-cyclic 3'-phosphodiesterase
VIAHGAGAGAGEPARGEPAKTARLFFALWPSPAMQSELAAAVDPAVLEALNAGGGARRVSAANFHLTLAFLGSVPLTRLDDVKAAAARCGQSPRPEERSLDILLDGIEHWRKPQVLVVTASQTPPAAVALAERLKRSLIDRGFSPDLKPFRVHATVARKVRRVTREVRIEPVRWRFESFHLVSSTTGPEGSTYTPIAEWMLQDVDVTE